jgi:hypothetical protein
MFFTKNYKSAKGTMKINKNRRKKKETRDLIGCYLEGKKMRNKKVMK